MRYYCLQGLFKGYNRELGNVAWGSPSGTTLSIIKALLQGRTGWNSISHQSLKSFKVTKVHSSSKWNAESWARQRICFLWHLNCEDGVGPPGSSAGLKKGCGYGLLHTVRLDIRAWLPQPKDEHCIKLLQSVYLLHIICFNDSSVNRPMQLFSLPLKIAVELLFRLIGIQRNTDRKDVRPPTLFTHKFDTSKNIVWGETGVNVEA